MSQIHYLNARLPGKLKFSRFLEAQPTFLQGDAQKKRSQLMRLAFHMLYFWKPRLLLLDRHKMKNQKTKTWVRKKVTTARRQ